MNHAKYTAYNLFMEPSFFLLDLVPDYIDTALRATSAVVVRGCLSNDASIVEWRICLCVVLRLFEYAVETMFPGSMPFCASTFYCVILSFVE